MKLSPNWIRDFVDLTVDDRRLAEDLTNVGIAVEGISGAGADTVFEMEIGTNRPDAMNHYGVAREAAAIYDLPLKQLSALSSQLSAKAFARRAVPHHRRRASTLSALFRARRFAVPASSRRPKKLRTGCNCSTSAPSRTLSTPPTTFSGRSASPPMSSTWTCSRAARSLCARLAPARP